MNPAPPKTVQIFRGAFIRGPWFDGLLIIGAPLVAILCGWLLSLISPAQNSIFILDKPALISALAMKTIIHSHLVIVFFRSHGNPQVRGRHPWRFWVTPVILTAAMFFFPAVLAVSFVVTTYWDIYHSSLQTFGLGRIYDMKAGADVNQGRHLEIWLNHLIYIGPFIAGPHWITTMSCFEPLKKVDLDGTPVVTQLATAQPALSMGIYIAAPVLLIAYVVHLVKRVRGGERVSWQKLLLLATTAATSVWAWRLNDFFTALAIVNIFHAVQYFAIVYWSENKVMGRFLGLSTFPMSGVLVAAALIILAVSYGFWVVAAAPYFVPAGWLRTLIFSVTNVVSILHFWYDGFIWSVRKKDVG